MNKQEAIEKINELRQKFAISLSRRNGKSYCLKKDVLVANKQDVIDIINQIDEPEKPVIPQFVAEWVEKCKTFKNFAVSLSFALQPSVWEANRLSDKCIEWLTDAENQDIFARAWLDGYEVEEEPIYVIRSKGTTNKYGAQQRLCHSGEKGNYFWCGEFSKFKHKFTREELEQAGFGWVFDCEGVEVREVE